MVYLEVAVMCAERRTDEWDCVSICTFLFSPPSSLSKLSPPRILVFMLRSLGPHKGPTRGRWLAGARATSLVWLGGSSALG